MLPIVQTCPSCQKRFADEVTTCPDDGAELVLDEELSAGATVGEYRVVRTLGAGGYGFVYAAEHPLIGKRAAIKVLHRRFSSEVSIVSRFVAEARAVNLIRHPNIIDVFSFGQMTDGRRFLVMELLDGASLRQILERRGKLAFGDALPILRGIADALDAAHRAGIAHRDLKPDNVFVALGAGGVLTPKLLDFGVAKLLGDESSGHRTATGQAIGTPLYMAPEQCRGRGVDQRADLYAFGVVVFEVLTGTTPFEAETTVDLLFKHMLEPPPSIGSVAPELPAALDVPLAALLAKKASDRPESANAGLDAVVQAARDAGMELEPTGTPLLPLDERAAPADKATPATVRVGRASVVTDVPVSLRAPEEARSGDDLVTDPGGDTLAAPTTKRRELTSPLPPATDGPQSLDAVVTPDARPPRRLPRGLLVGGVAVALALAAALVLRPFEEPGAPAPPAATLGAAGLASAAMPEPPSSSVPVEVTPAVAATSVEVRLTTEPDDVDVFLGERRLGSSREPLLLPTGGGQVVLRLVRAGYQTAELTVVPEAGQQLSARLVPAAKTSPRPGAGARPAAGPKDLDKLLQDR